MSAVDKAVDAVDDDQHANSPSSSGSSKRRSYPSGGAGPSAGKEDRNFRSLYYEKVGFRGVDERKTIEALLAEDPISREKCAHFALKFGVPADRRRTLWKVVLNVSAVYPNNREYVSKWKAKPYKDVTRALKVMGKTKDSFPKAKNLTITHLLLANRLKFDVESQLLEEGPQNYMAVAETVVNLSQSCDDAPQDESGDAEMFWIVQGLYALLERQNEGILSEMMQIFHKHFMCTTSNKALCSHMEKIGLTSELPLRTWFLRGFAGILHEVALERIWDKVVGGSLVILVHVAIALVETTRMALMQCQTAQEGIRCLVSTSQETDDIIAQKAVDSWSADGCHLLPGDKGGAGLHRPTSQPKDASAATAIRVAQASSTPRPESFQLSSEIRIPEDFDLTGPGDGASEEYPHDNKDYS